MTTRIDVSKCAELWPGKVSGISTLIQYGKWKRVAKSLDQLRNELRKHSHCLCDDHEFEAAAQKAGTPLISIADIRTRCAHRAARELAQAFYFGLGQTIDRIGHSSAVAGIGHPVDDGDLHGCQAVECQWGSGFTAKADAG